MKRKFLIPLFAFLLMLGGCASSIKRVDFDEPVRLEKNETLVFGKISIIENGKEVSFSFFGRSLEVCVKKDSGEVLMLPSIDKYGNFIFIAEEGGYMFAQIDQIHLTDEDIKIFPKIFFRVHAGDKVIYIGTVKIKYIINQYGHFKEPLSIEVLDEFDKSIEIIEPKIPDLKSQIEKKLAIYESYTISPDIHRQLVCGYTGAGEGILPVPDLGCSLTGNSGENSDFFGVFWFSIILILLFGMKEIMKVIK